MGPGDVGAPREAACEAAALYNEHFSLRCGQLSVLVPERAAETLGRVSSCINLHGCDWLGVPQPVLNFKTSDICVG